MSNKAVFFSGVVTGIAATMAVLIGGSVYIARQATKALEKAIASGDLLTATPAVAEPVAAAE